MPLFNVLCVVMVRWMFSIIGCLALFLSFLQQGHSAETSSKEPEAFRSADLPPVLRFLDGEPVNSMEDWQRRREEIAHLWCETYIGHFPERTPDLLEVHVASETQRQDSVMVRDVRLIFMEISHFQGITTGKGLS